MQFRLDHASDVSVVPPGENGTTNLKGWLGYFAGSSAAEVAASPDRANATLSKADLNARRFIMILLYVVPAGWLNWRTSLSFWSVDPEIRRTETPGAGMCGGTPTAVKGSGFPGSKLLPNLERGQQLAEVGVEMLDAHDVVERRAGARADVVCARQHGAHLRLDRRHQIRLPRNLALASATSPFSSTAIRPESNKRSPALTAPGTPA